MARTPKPKVDPKEEERLQADPAEDTDLDAEEDADEEESDDSDSDAEEDADEDKIEEKPVEKAPAKRSTTRRATSVTKPARLKPALEEDAVEEEKVDTDYLRQYQYKKVNNVPTIGGVETDPDKGSKAEKMKAHLLAQSRVRVLVPREQGEDKSVLMSVNLNGYRLDFPKNAYVDMPEQIAEVIMKSQDQTNRALEVSRIDGDSDKETALR